MTGVSAAQNFYVSALNAPQAEKSRSCIVKCYEGIKAVVINPDTAAWINSLCGLARSVYSAVMPFFKAFARFAAYFAATAFTSAITMPFDLYQLIVDSANLCVEKGKKAFIDNVLGCFADASQLVDGGATFAGALVDLGAVSSTVGLVATPVSFACSIVSSVFFVIGGLGIYHSKKLLGVFKPEKINDSETLTKKVNKHAYRLNRQAGIDTDLFLETIKTINTSSKTKDEESIKLNQACEALRTRIKQKIAAHALSMLVTLIGIIASTIFFIAMFTPLLPLSIAGASTLAVVFSLSIGKMTFEMYSSRRFSKQMEKISKVPNLVPQAA